jgi:alkylhydroperoxidase family enzyme
MAHIQTVPIDAAEGPLAKIYRDAIQRAGKVFQILQVQSLNPQVLRASMGLYMATTTSPDNSLPRWVREAIAVVVSKANDCFY